MEKENKKETRFQEGDEIRGGVYTIIDATDTYGTVSLSSGETVDGQDIIGYVIRYASPFNDQFTINAEQETDTIMVYHDWDLTKADGTIWYSTDGTSGTPDTNNVSTNTTNLYMGKTEVTEASYMYGIVLRMTLNNSMTIVANTFEKGYTNFVFNQSSFELNEDLYQLSLQELGETGTYTFITEPYTGVILVEYYKINDTTNEIELYDSVNMHNAFYVASLTDLIKLTESGGR